MVEGFISSSLTVDIIIFGALSLLALLITEVLSPTFSKGCEIHADKNVKNVMEEDPKDRVQKEADLLKWYDPGLILMPIILRLVKKCFGEVASKLAERNLNGVNTDMSDVSDKLPK